MAQGTHAVTYAAWNSLLRSLVASQQLLYDRVLDTLKVVLLLNLVRRSQIFPRSL